MEDMQWGAEHGVLLSISCAFKNRKTVRIPVEAMSEVYKQSGMSIQHVCDMRLKGFQYCLKKISWSLAETWFSTDLGLCQSYAS